LSYAGKIKIKEKRQKKKMAECSAIKTVNLKPLFKQINPAHENIF